jgi:hypothetical protein
MLWLSTDASTRQAAVTDFHPNMSVLVPPETIANNRVSCPRQSHRHVILRLFLFGLFGETGHRLGDDGCHDVMLPTGDGMDLLVHAHASNL